MKRNIDRVKQEKVRCQLRILASLLGIETLISDARGLKDFRGWESQLSDKLKLNSLSTLSTWIRRGKIPTARLYEIDRLGVPREKWHRDDINPTRLINALFRGDPDYFRPTDIGDSSAPGVGTAGEGERNNASNVEPHAVDTELLGGAMAIHPEDLPTVELFKRFDNWLQTKSHREQGWYVTELLRKFPDFHDHLKKTMKRRTESPETEAESPQQNTGTDGTN